MMRPRTELERLLASDPFDTALRAEYALQLLEAGEHGTALRQYELLRKQAPAQAAFALGVARCAWKEGDTEAARRAYAEARGLEGFTEDAELAQALGAARVQPGLRVVQGEAPREPPVAEVVPLTASGTVRFADIVGMEELKRTIRLRIVEPFLKPGLFARFAKKTGGGLLLYGPPGCGKTLIARAIAGECKATFISVGISDVLNMWIGESERNLSALFEKARGQRPAVLFFDELDALAYSRSKASSEHTRALVNEFLNQLDGMAGNNERILVLAATNMPWDVDNAMKRPGRFDKQVFVPPPDAEARAEMFRLKLRGLPTEAIEPLALAQVTAQASGADIDGIIEEAKERVLADIVERGVERSLTQADLLEAARASQPSTLEWLRTAKNLVKYGGDGAYRDVEAYLKAHRLLV
ncbi:ATP-binding protein [Cystobacter fuscus]|uniref:ATP-binding protein n=1 Tax=Cystobacter fuscus TaxID=43 RepID=UPI002B2CE70C|nr:ATP-binding protein [Cystobacter fuscus]